MLQFCLRFCGDEIIDGVKQVAQTVISPKNQTDDILKQFCLNSDLFDLFYEVIKRVCNMNEIELKSKILKTRNTILKGVKF